MSARQTPIARGHRARFAAIALVVLAATLPGIAWPTNPPQPPPTKSDEAGSETTVAPPAGDVFAWYWKRPSPDRKVWKTVLYSPDGEFVNLGKRTDAARHGDIATVWTFTEYRRAQTDKTHNLEYLGQAIQLDYDCKKHLRRGYAAIRYPGPSMTGTPIEMPTRDPQAVDWEPVPPATTGTRLMEWACAATAPAHKGKSGR
jgi:hypothetical protein